MQKNRPPWRPLLAAAPALYAAACRAVPAFGRAALARVSVPAMAALHRLTARVPFPVAEPAALLLAAALAAALRRRRSPAALLLAVAGLLALLWAPALARPLEAPPTPDSAALARLCGELIAPLNRAPLAFPAPADILARAPAAAGLPGCAVKAARYPEWMALTRAWGLFVPLTGEALVDAGAPAPLLPFTAVHELMHLTGVADEGAANLAAWERCLDAGGPFADSARLWALRYAMGLLRDQDEAAWRAAGAKMKNALARVYLECGGDAAPGRPGTLPLLRGDYADLAAYLAARGVGSRESQR